jgi:hypothetical protein
MQLERVVPLRHPVANQLLEELDQVIMSTFQLNSVSQMENDGQVSNAWQ